MKTALKILLIAALAWQVVGMLIARGLSGGNLTLTDSLLAPWALLWKRVRHSAAPAPAPMVEAGGFTGDIVSVPTP